MDTRSRRWGTALGRLLGSIALGGAVIMFAAVPAQAQTGVDDDRVSLPEGPGSLEGLGDNVEIDPNMGSMRTTVPVIVPEGFGSLTPDLTLSYSSAASSGPLGIGWSMPEMSIERMTARQVPLYDTDDFFAANGGDELVQIERVGSDYVYRSRFEKEFTRYTWVAAGSGADGYWTAQFADGTVGYFGADKNGNTVASARSTHPTAGTFRYLLVDHVDPYGHTLHYDYQADFGDDLNNRPLLRRVSWLDDGTGDPLYTAELAYEGRDDYLSDAGAGYEELLTRRLAGITIRNGNETIREYVLTYEEAAGGLSRLVSAEQYGLGGVAGGQRYPVAFSFGYQKGLGIECEAGLEDCGDGPIMVDMGNVAGGANLASGKATLIDINGDGLADILDTGQGQHDFYINRLTPDGSGGFTHGFLPSPITTAQGTTLVLTHASDTVQVLDFNGDGFSDMIHTESGTILLNDPDFSDWLPPTSTDVSRLVGLDFTQARFFDYDNNKRIDVLQALDTATAKVYANQDDGFEVLDIDGLGTPLPADGVQMADFNGDGLNDIVRVTRDGLVDRNLNLGRGVWTGFETLPGVAGLDEDEHNVLDLEDINGDGLNDLLVVGQGQIKYKINRAGRSFESLTLGEDWTTITSADIDGTIPDRTNKVVLYADMNANGSEDVVWFDASGNVQYLELFPSRPNLLSRIDNGIGFVQKITYGTAAEHAARAEAAGSPWQTPLPHPTAVVDQTDIFVSLTGNEDGTGLHEIKRYTYRNGWYDGVEKQFRGFSDVTTELVAAEGQEGGTIVSEYDLGRTLASDPTSGPHRNGLQLREIVSSGGQILAEKVMEYDNCDLTGVRTPAQLVAEGKKPVVHPCMTAEQSLIKERLTSEADWITVRTEMQYDGFGQVTLNSQLGDIDADGDEDYTRTSYYEPTAEFWMLGLVAREEHSADPDFPAADTNLTLNYYDGDDFVGLPEGQATHGFLTRTERAVAPGEFIQELRQRRDEHGNSVETIDPNGTVGGADHRRTYEYDETGKFLIQTDLHVSEDYALRRESRFERNFQKVIEATQWMLVDNDEVKTARNSTQLRYDEFGRLVERFEPGDTDTPTQRITWDLGDPFSRAIMEERSGAGSDFDRISVQCFDGKGRVYQTRNRLDEGVWLVDGFTRFNANGEEVELFQAFTVRDPDGDQCSDVAPAATVRSGNTTFDALGRVIEQTAPGEDIYGEPLVKRTVYLPLAVENWDFEDTTDGPHAATPTRVIMDGLDRAIAVERTLADGTVARTSLRFDATNSFAGYTDAAGNVHELTVDLADRVVAARDPNTGTTTFDYDDAGNIVAMTDARGVTVQTVYDGLNRLRERFDPANRDATLVTWHYDTLPSDCELTECTNLAAQLAMIRYPVDLGNGRVEQGSDRFGYDVRQRQILAARRFGMLADLPVTSTYNNQDEIVSTTYPDGTVVDYTFDLAGRPTGIAGFLANIEYDDRSDWTAFDYPNGARLERTLDGLQRESRRTVTSASGTVVLDHALTLNRVDKITGLDANDDIMGTADTLRVNLDAWYRPTAATLGDEDLSFGYDVIDRILSLSSDAAGSPMDHGELTYSDAQPLAVTAVGALSMAYNPAGMMTGRGDDTFERDALGRLVGVTRDGAAHAQMTYGADDRVVQRTEDGTLVLYGFDDFEVRDGVARLYGRVEGTYIGRKESTALMTTVYPDATGDGELNAADAFVALQQGDEAMPTAHILAASAARLLVEQEAEGTTSLHTDYLGSIVAATDAGGEVRGRRGFYPFGLVRYEADGSDVDVRGFTGQEHDVATGMIHMMYRELDPVTGRWDRFDPSFVKLDADAATNKLGEATTGYAYIANGPFDGADPTGLEGEDAKALAKQLAQKQNQLKDKKNERGKKKTADYDLKRDLKTETENNRDLNERIDSKVNEVRTGSDDQEVAYQKLSTAKLISDVKVQSLKDEISNNQKQLTELNQFIGDLENDIKTLETRIQQLMATPSVSVEIDTNITTDNKQPKQSTFSKLFNKVFG